DAAAAAGAARRRPHSLATRRRASRGGAMSAEVRSMFAAIAPRYDAANQVLSLGIHKGWRRKAVEVSGARPGQRILDCATGTGDLAIELKRAVGPDGEVI